MSPTLPVALKLEGRPCLVVGNGEEAVRRARNLCEAGAEVVLVASAPSQELCALASELGLSLAQREYQTHDLDGKWLAVSCDHDSSLAERMGRDAAERQVFYCAVDQPDYNSFAHVGITRSGPVFVAIGTDGSAPALARRLRLELARALELPEFVEFARFLVELRARTPASERAEVLTRAARRLRLEGGFVIDHDDA